MRTIPELMAEIQFWAWVGLVAGVVLFASAYSLWLRWRRLERWVAAQARHHERMAEAVKETYPRIMHKWSAKSYDMVLVAMDELARGRRIAR